jgi:hypothetical protein
MPREHRDKVQTAEQGGIAGLNWAAWRKTRGRGTAERIRQKRKRKRDRKRKGREK